LKKVLKRPEILPKIEDAVLRMNEIATRSYQFIKFYIWHLFINNKPIPTINKPFLTKVFDLVAEKRKNKTRPVKVKPNSLRNFYNKHFGKFYTDKPCKTNLNSALKELKEEMIRCIETNIKTHFIDYIRKYINILYRNPARKIIKDNKTLTKAARTALYKALNKEMKDLKNDFIKCQVKDSDPKYHQWLQNEIKTLFPFKVNQHVAYHVKEDPQKYLLPALRINRKIEELEKSPYQVIPQRSNYVPKNITLNTAGLIEIISDKNNEIFKYKIGKMVRNIKQYQSCVWRTILKLEHKSIFNSNKYVFFNQIQTDGVSVSLLFIRKDFANRTFGEKQKYKMDGKRKKEEKKQKKEDDEIVQLNEMTKEQCDKYKGRTLIGIDPGKKSIITMTDGNKFYSYSNCRRRTETYTKRSLRVINKMRVSDGIKEIEILLSKESGRTTSPEKFLQYLKVRNQNLPKLKEFYNQLCFRNMRLRRYINTKKSQDVMLNEIEQKFGSRDEVLLGLGNWSNNQTKQMKGCMPSPNKGIYRILSQRFDIVEVDEFKTSKIYNDDLSQELVNLKVKKGKHFRSVHSLLTLTGKKDGVILNRDKNAAKNILLILSTHMKNQMRPAAFCR
jgi:hypothetical protein